MTQHLDIEELQNLLKTVVEETTAITEKLATKASKILSKHENFDFPPKEKSFFYAKLQRPNDIRKELLHLHHSHVSGHHRFDELDAFSSKTARNAKMLNSIHLGRLVNAIRRRSNGDLAPTLQRRPIL